MSDRPTRVIGIVLAAGGSSRLGVPKQLIEFRGETLVSRAARAMATAGVRAVLVVVGAESPEIAQALSGLSLATTIVNDRWRNGLASSVATGVREVQCLDPRADGVMFTTSDLPLVSAAGLSKLLDAFDDGARLVASAYSGTVGVPAVIACEYFDALLELEGDAGAGRWLREKGDRVHRIAMPEAAVDIDSAEDAALLASMDTHLEAERGLGD